MKFFLPILLTCLLIASCKPKVSETEPGTTDSPALSADLQNYENEVMKIHDEVMPKMADINKLATRLRDIKASAGQNADGVSNAPEGLDKALESLRKAEQSMMDWMKNYSDTKAKITPDLMAVFLERELLKITEVRNIMLNAIDEANAWLAAHPS